MRISDWSSDVCSSDLPPGCHAKIGADSLSGFKSTRIIDRVAVSQGSDRSNAWNGHEPPNRFIIPGRSEEHTSELQSLMRISYAVFCLKKKKESKRAHKKTTKHSQHTRANNETHKHMSCDTQRQQKQHT